MGFDIRMSGRLLSAFFVQLGGARGCLQHQRGDECADDDYLLL